jgi:glycosyltransferase involved in cell wall biosynthesis
MHILAICDSPTAKTGFGCVARNLLRHWHAAGHTCAVWGINYNGWPHDLPYKIYPATFTENAHFRSPNNLERLLKHLVHHRYDIVWFMQDLFNFGQNKFPEAFRQTAEHAVKEGRPWRSLYYFPADCVMDPDWFAILRVIDEPVAYTRYGRRQLPAELQRRCSVQPHGVETDVFYPSAALRQARNELFSGPWLSERDLLLVNVNQNQPRKAPHLSLQLLAELKRLKLPVKLVMHMPQTSAMGDLDLELIGPQFGLKHGRDWVHSGALFAGNQGVKGEDYLNQLYNAADLTISTSLGEGWGLSITESLAAGCPVAAPACSSIPELSREFAGYGMYGRIIQLPLCGTSTCNRHDLDRIRYPIDVQASAVAIAQAHFREAWPGPRLALTEKARHWLDWSRIAHDWLNIMGANA